MGGNCQKRYNESKNTNNEFFRTARLEQNLTVQQKRENHERRFKLIQDYRSKLDETTIELRNEVNNFKVIKENFKHVQESLTELTNQLDDKDLLKELDVIDKLHILSRQINELKKYKEDKHKKSVYKVINMLRGRYNEFIEQEALHYFYDSFSPDGAHIRNYLDNVKEGQEGYTSYKLRGADNYAKKIIEQKKQKIILDGKYGEEFIKLNSIENFYRNFHEQYSGLKENILKKEDEISNKLLGFINYERLAIEDIKKEFIKREVLHPKTTIYNSETQTRKEKIKTRKESLFNHQIASNYRESNIESNSNMQLDKPELYHMHNPRFPLVTLFTINSSLESKLDENGRHLKNKMLSSSAMRTNISGNGFVYCSFHPNQEGGHHKIKFKDASMDLRFYGTGEVIKINEQNKKEIESRLNRDKGKIHLEVGQHVMLVSMNAEANHDQKETKRAMSRA